jgi:hypothetical protein
MGLTPVIGFLDEQGIDVLAPSLDDIVEVLQHGIETTYSEQPFRVTVAIEGETGTLDVSLDEELGVTSLDRPRSN